MIEKVYRLSDLPKLMKDPTFYVIRDPKTNKIIEAGRMRIKRFNLDDANDLRYIGGDSSFNLGKVPGGTSSTRPGGVREETSI